MKRKAKIDTRMGDKVAYMLTIGWIDCGLRSDGYMISMDSRRCLIDSRGVTKELRTDEVIDDVPRITT